MGNLGTGSGLEFVIRIGSAGKADLLVIPSYNAAMSRFATVSSSDGIFERISMLVNGQVKTKDGRSIPEKYFDASALRRGPFDEAGNLWNSDGTRISLRLPWTWINVTDPSSLRVLQDPRTGYFNGERDALKTRVTDGFLVDSIVWDRKRGEAAGALGTDPSKPYLWEGWETAPPYREKYKKSYYLIREAWADGAMTDRKLR